MALIAQARQAPITSYATAANLLTARGQRYQDILAKALGGYQTAAEQANIAAENAWRLYQDAVAQREAARARAASSNNGISLEDVLKLFSTEENSTQSGGGGYVDDEEETGENWSQKVGSVIKGIPTLIGNYLGNTLVPKPGKKMTFMEKLLNQRSNKGSGSKGRTW